MPKIIENLRESILAEAERQLAAKGYSGMTVRSVAEGCGVAVGTLYNYFPSKAEITAALMLRDWQAALTAAEQAVTNAADPAAILDGVHGILLDFVERHRSLFADAEAVSTFGAAQREHHAQLRAQLAALLGPLTEAAFTRDFIAEALLTWTTEGGSWPPVRAMLLRLL